MRLSRYATSLSRIVRSSKGRHLSFIPGGLIKQSVGPLSCVYILFCMACLTTSWPCFSRTYCKLLQAVASSSATITRYFVPDLNVRSYRPLASFKTIFLELTPEGYPVYAEHFCRSAFVAVHLLKNPLNIFFFPLF